MAHPWPSTNKHPWRTAIDPAYFLDSPKSTGATAGAPGVFTPAGSGGVNTFGELGDVVASPTSGWTTGQYVVCNSGEEAYWGGSSWSAGRAAATKGKED